MGNRQTSWQNKHRRRDSFVIEGRRPPWAKLPMWNGRAFKLCVEKFAGRNWAILSQREAGTHGVGGRLGLQLYFDSSEIGRKDLCSQTPLQPSYPKRPVRHHHGVLTLGSLAIGDGTATDTTGFLATTSALFGDQPSDSRPLASGWMLFEEPPITMMSCPSRSEFEPSGRFSIVSSKQLLSIGV